MIVRRRIDAPPRTGNRDRPIYNSIYMATPVTVPNLGDSVTQATLLRWHKPDGQAVVRDLCARADVVIENFKVGGLARYGLDAHSLRQINPRLVVCSITGFGQDGPYAARAGYDPHAAVTMLNRLKALGGESKGPNWFGSHPLTGNRVDRMQEMIADLDTGRSPRDRSRRDIEREDRSGSISDRNGFGDRYDRDPYDRDRDR